MEVACEGLRRRGAELEAGLAARFTQTLEELANLNTDRLQRFLDLVESNHSGDDPRCNPSSVLTSQASVLVISQGDDGEVTSDACETDADIICTAVKAVEGHRATNLISSSNPNRDKFWRAIEDFIVPMTNEGGPHLFFYAGHGCEIRGSFRFIPCEAERAEDYIPLGQIMSKIDAQVTGCQIIFCIGSCRDNPFRQDVCDRWDNEVGTKNEYFLLFSTSSGQPSPDSHNQSDATIFAQTVAEFIPKLNGPMVSDVMHSIIATIKERDEQSEAWFYCGGQPSLKSMRSSSVSSTSSMHPTATLWRGYSVFSAKHTKSISPSSSDQVYRTTDIRKDHRRRVNRMTAPVVAPKCIILDSTGDRCAEDVQQDFARRGMGPNYLITKEGRRVLLVEEENMAWDYNLAFWGSGVVDQQGYIPGVGQINELKSYAISIQMESDEGKFADAQYDALNLLLKDVMARHRMQPWDVVSAGEVVQPPPKKPQPGPHFEWQRLDECLHAKEFQAATLYDITELKQKLQEGRIGTQPSPLPFPP
ncbi:unnamed protein product [Effrenium voratum]|uniref:Uncharacterized protein n=1 Tax=Effrenium voratum TaxID=2562239 RepID=A0AA36MHU7_9DINO|nr:unnamed protein product [Effrenium voratum]